MRCRTASSVPIEQMEKGTGKNHNTRLCFLASLLAFFWILLLYVHFVVLGTSNSNATGDSLKLQPSNVNTDSINTHLPDPHQIQSDTHLETTRSNGKWRGGLRHTHGENHRWVKCQN
uniref:Uncharacterized protein n=1 Tax=Quercus lobata TaxID=97700 RepID=A0A7N2LEZ3_QUELO